MKNLILAVLALVGLMQPAAAQESDAPLLEIPFAPPIDAPLRYRLVTERSSDGKTRTGAFEQELQYRLVDDEYELTVTTLSISDGNITITPAMALLNPAMQEALALAAPVTLALDEYGAPLYVVDWDAHRERLERLPSILAGSEPPAERADARAVAERAIAPMLAVSEEQAVDLLLKYWPSFLGWGGTAQPAGEPLDYSGEVQSPLAPVLLLQQGRLFLEETAAGGLKLRLSEETDSAAIQQAMMAYFDSLGSADDPKHLAMMARLKTDLADAQNTNTMEILFAPETGTIQSARIERKFDFAIGSGTEVATIELID